MSQPQLGVQELFLLVEPGTEALLAMHLEPSQKAQCAMHHRSAG